MPGEVTEAEAVGQRVKYTIEFEDGTEVDAVMGPYVGDLLTRMTSEGAESLAEELPGTEVKGSAEQIKSHEEPIRTAEAIFEDGGEVDGE